MTLSLKVDDCPLTSHISSRPLTGAEIVGEQGNRGDG
jgi:hypothetical protein